MLKISKFLQDFGGWFGFLGCIKKQKPKETFAKKTQKSPQKSLQSLSLWKLYLDILFLQIFNNKKKRAA